MTPNFSVVIPTHNRKESLVRCLASLAGQSFPVSDFEVIVVDDGSTDGTQVALENQKWGFHLTYLVQQNSGPSVARNFGVNHARGETIAFTEDDIEVHPDWLTRAASYFQDASLGLLEGRTVYAGTGKDVRRFEHLPRHGFIPCNLFIRRDVIHRLGGYDPAFYDPKTKLYFREDADLGFQILESGVTTTIATDVVVEHPEQFSNLAACFRHVQRYYFDPLLYRKHPRLFRDMIEVKTIVGLTVHRPQHYLALLDVVLLGSLIGSLVQGDVTGIYASGAGVFVCSILFRYKYQGRKAIRRHRILETFGFVLLPFVYVSSFIRGCLRFKSFGSIL